MSFVKRLLALTLLVMLAFGSTSHLYAQQGAGSGSGLSISPTRFELTIKPGQADKIDITLKNVTSGDIVAKPFINDFLSDNETGDPKVIVDESKRSPASIRDFVMGLDEVKLAKGEQKKVTLPVQLPANVVPGAYFGLVRYESVPTGSNAPAPGQVALSASVGSIVLIDVPGNVTERVQLKNVYVYKGDSRGSLFTQKPDKAGIEVHNLGNGFSKPFGRVEVQGMGGKPIYSYEMNNTDPRANVLPASSRIFKDPIKNITAPGRYTVVANISYGKGSEILVSKTSFWYIPLWMLIIIILIVALVVGGLYMAYRRYNGSSRSSTRRRK